MGMRYVRGMSFEDVSDDVDRLKREGQLERPLELAYECSDAIERANAVIGVAGAGRWYERQAIILRKLGALEAEVRLLEEVHRRFSEDQIVGDRLPRARALIAKRATTGRS